MSLLWGSWGTGSGGNPTVVSVSVVSQCCGGGGGPHGDGAAEAKMPDRRWSFYLLNLLPHQ